MNNKEVWIYIEHEKGKISDVSLELISKGKELATKLNTKVAAVILGKKIANRAPTLFAYGAEKVYMVEDDSLEIYKTLAHTRHCIFLAKKYNPEVFLIGATIIGRDLAPRISSALNCGLTADCTELDVQSITHKKENYENLLLQTRPAFGGNIIATIISPLVRPEMATVREGVMTIIEPDYSRSGELISEPFITDNQDSLVEIVERIKEEKEINLKDSEIIISFGAGVGSAENVKLVEQLAKTLNGQLGATRAAVEKGYISREHQIGQTGITVRPRLYIACGISGAIQHRAGMEQSGTIIAFNKDPNAPICKFAHYAIIGDIKRTIPEFLAAYKRRVKA